jgi:hypothetical protein
MHNTTYNYRMADVAQLVRALGCGSKGRRFNPDHSPLMLIF